MLKFNTHGDALKIVLIAALVGALASLVAELLIARGKSKQTGIIELPGPRGPRFWDLGSLAAIPVGILAAVIAAFLFAPGQEMTVRGDIVRKVEEGRLILTAAIAGLSSAGFLALVQERFLAVAKNERLDAALNAAVQGLDSVKQSAKTPAPKTDSAHTVTTLGEHVAEKVDGVKAAVIAAKGE